MGLRQNQSVVGGSRSGGQTAREQMITDNVDLVHYIVGRIAINLPEKVDRDDLISAGLIGLVKAADRFDVERGIKFRTYASTVVRGEVMESLRAKDWAPRSVRRKAREVAAAVAGLEARLHRAPTDIEIAESLEIDIDDYYALLSETSGANLMSLDELIEQWQLDAGGGMNNLTAADSENPAAVVDHEALLDCVAAAVERLPKREQFVVGLYYQEELTLQEIGEVLGVTESRICQIHTQAVARLRASLHREIGIP